MKGKPMLLDKWQWLTYEHGGWFLWQSKPYWDKTQGEFRVHKGGGKWQHCPHDMILVPSIKAIKDDKRLWKRDGDDWVHDTEK